MQKSSDNSNNLMKINKNTAKYIRWGKEIGFTDQGSGLHFEKNGKKLSKVILTGFSPNIFDEIKNPGIGLQTYFSAAQLICTAIAIAAADHCYLILISKISYARVKYKVYFKESYKIKCVGTNSVHTDDCKKTAIKRQCIRTAKLTSRTPENEDSNLSALYSEVD